MAFMWGRENGQQVREASFLPCLHMFVAGLLQFRGIHNCLSPWCPVEGHERSTPRLNADGLAFVQVRQQDVQGYIASFEAEEAGAAFHLPGAHQLALGSSSWTGLPVEMGQAFA